MRFPKLAVLLALLALSALLVSSCGKKPPEEEVIYEEPYEEAVAEEEVVEEEVPMGEEEVLLEEVTEEEVVEEIPPPPPAETVGYRVQIGAFEFETGKWGGAQLWASQARAKFTEPVYVEFDAGLYKVRVGDLVTREEADVLKAKAIQLGYAGAFVVEATITPGPR